MNTSHLAPRANSGGALPPRSSARLKALGIISRFPTGAWGTQLRRLTLIGCCLLPAAQGFASSSVTLAWDPTTDPDVAGYELRYGESSGNYTTTVQAGNTNTKSVSGLTEGKTYYFAVFAYNTAGLKSAPSNEATHSVGVSPIANDTIKVHYVSSEQSDMDPARYAIDGDPNTFWHSEWKTSAPPPPHELQLDLGSVQNLRGFRYLTRQDALFNGTIAQYEFFVSSDGINWGNPVASGFLEKTKSVQQVLFTSTSGRYVRLRALSEVDGKPYTNVAELTLLRATSSATNSAPSAIAQTLTTPENTPVSIVLTGTDPESSPLTYTVVSNPSKGVLGGTPPNLTYTPAAGFNGSDSLTFRVNDGSLDSAPATIAINVTPVNDAPIAGTQSVTTAEDTELLIVLAGSDKDADVLSYSVDVGPKNGTITGTGPNLTYRPAANFNGSDSFTFRVNDGTVFSSPATVSINITAINDAPHAIAQTLTTAEDTPFSIVLAGTDVEGSPLTYTVVTGPANGTLSGTAPNLTFTPTKNFNGSDSFTFRANDGALNSNTATVLINVAAVNDAPSAIAKSFTTPENTPVSIVLTGTDPESSPLTYTVVSNPSKGVLGGTPPNLTYTPAAGFNGSDSLTFRANDGTLNSNTATITINVTPVNDAPIAGTQSVTTAEDTEVLIVLAGSDKDADVLSYSVDVGPKNGTITGTGSNLTYRPAANFNGSDSFTFRVNDGTVFSSPATVSINITAINDAPHAIAQTLTTAENTPFSIVLAGTDVEGSPLTYTVVTGPTNGTLSGTAPNLTYIPATQFNGSDSLTFRVNDGSLDSELAAISISITSAVTPVIKVHYVSSEQSDVDPAWHAIDGDPNTFWHSEWKTTAPPPPHELQLDLGSIQNLRGFRYLTRQDALFNGTIAQYEFYISSDGINWGNPVVSGFLQKTKAVQQVLFASTSGRYVRLRALSEVDGKPYTNVAELTFLQETSPDTNTAPSAVAQSFNTPEDTPVSIVLTGSDPEGSLLTYAIVSGPTKGKIGGTPPNLTYAPAADFNGSDSLTFRVNDGSLDSQPATISITVTPVNDAPIAIAKSYTTLQATPIAIVLGGSDKESGILDYTVVSGPASGSLSGVAPDLTYSPTANFSGNDSFTFRVNDGTADSGEATISIGVTAVEQVVTNVPPTFPRALIEVSATEDKAFRGQLSATDANPGDTLTFAKVSGPGWLVVTPSGRLGGTPLNEDVGANSFTLSVTDSANATATATLLINVANTNDAPTFSKASFTYPSGAEQTAYTGQTLAGTATDPDKNDTLTYSKINGPSWLLISKTGELSGTPPLGSKGLNKFTIRASDMAGASSRAALQIQIDQNSLPLPWTANTIGVASMEAEAEYSAGNYTLAGAGTLTSTEDTGTFGYQTLTADGEIIARVTKLDDTGAAAHVGVTIRESLAPNSRLVSIGVNGAAAPRQLTRTSTGGKTKKIAAKASSPVAYAASSPAQGSAKSAKSPKIWLRLVRKGDTVTSYTSSNGKKWQKVSTTNVKLRKNCYIGLSVSSGKNQHLNTSTFSNVKVRR